MRAGGICIRKVITLKHPGRSRRHFLSHLGGLAALSTPFTSFTNSLLANAEKLKKQHKSAILLWMGGGPSTMDIWDLKPGSNRWTL